MRSLRLCQLAHVDEVQRDGEAGGAGQDDAALRDVHAGLPEDLAQATPGEVPADVQLDLRDADHRSPRSGPRTMSHQPMASQRPSRLTTAPGARTRGDRPGPGAPAACLAPCPRTSTAPAARA